jgi:hypothetical protein
MDSFFQRIGVWIVFIWAAGMMAFLFFILKYLDGIARMLVYFAGG